MANEKKQVGDPCVYWLRIDLRTIDRSPKDCDVFARMIVSHVMQNFKTKRISFCNDVELKEMFGKEYQKFADEVNKSWAEAFKKQRDAVIEAYRKRTSNAATMESEAAR